jgi:hypothetical protein
MIIVFIVVDIKVAGISQRHVFSWTVACYVAKGKAIPLQAWTGPEGSRRLKLPDFKTDGT